MKKRLILFLAIVISLSMVSSVFASECPQKRKTKSAPGGMSHMNKIKKASWANGKKIFQKTAKPMACKICHGKKGAGDGKLGKALKPHPRNFTCKKTMQNVSAGQMFWIIKYGFR